MWSGWESRRTLTEAAGLPEPVREKLTKLLEDMKEE